MNKYSATKARVLFVEDNEINMQLALDILDPLEMMIDTANNGAQAVDMATANRYDLIIMDYMMPVMDGVTASILIRDIPGYSKESVPIVILTASNESADRFLSCGINDIVAKPLSYTNATNLLLKWVPHLIREVDTQTTAVDEDFCVPIEGIDFAKGRENCASPALYKKLLADFGRTVEENSDKIEEYIKEENYDGLMVLFLALMSASSIIGATDISKRIEKLFINIELRDYESFNRDYPSVIQDYGGIGIKIRERFNSENLLKAEKARAEAILGRLCQKLEQGSIVGARRELQIFERCVLPAGAYEIKVRLNGCLADAEERLNDARKSAEALKEFLGKC